MILEHRASTLKKTAANPSTAHHQSEEPPPYLPIDSARGTPAPPRPARASLSKLLPEQSPTSSARGAAVAYPDPPPPTVNQVHLISKKEDIIGTFYVDPLTPSLTPKRKKHGRRGIAAPHASFQTRTGAISLSLATTGNFKVAPRATVSVASRRGNIEIHLLPTPPTRPRIGLDTTSRSGDITLWLPETFSGVVQLSTKKGELHVLPHLFKVVKVLKETDTEAILLVGSQAEENNLTDLCQLNTRKGKVVVGLSGRDKHPEKTGFWKKLSEFLRGPP